MLLSENTHKSKALPLGRVFRKRWACTELRDLQQEHTHLFQGGQKKLPTLHIQASSLQTFCRESGSTLLMNLNY